MVDKVYIVWCKLNKSTDKFDLGVFTDKQKAKDVVKDYIQTQTIDKVWLKEYKLS